MEQKEENCEDYLWRTCANACPEKEWRAFSGLSTEAITNKLQALRTYCEGCEDNLPNQEAHACLWPGYEPFSSNLRLALSRLATYDEASHTVNLLPWTKEYVSMFCSGKSDMRLLALQPLPSCPACIQELEFNYHDPWSMLGYIFVYSFCDNSK